MSDHHPQGCFYGSFAGAYPDRWHIPFDSNCPLDHGDDPIRLDAPYDLGKVWTLYQCPVPDCKAFFACDADSHDGNGDMGWDPDGWSRCSEHSRPMKPIKVVGLAGAVAFAKKIDDAINEAAAQAIPEGEIERLRRIETVAREVCAAPLPVLARPADVAMARLRGALSDE